MSCYCLPEDESLMYLKSEKNLCGKSSGVDIKVYPTELGKREKTAYTYDEVTS